MLTFAQFLFQSCKLMLFLTFFLPPALAKKIIPQEYLS